MTDELITGRRGVKYCTECSCGTGPRSKYCPNCGMGFTIKGVKYPDVDVTTIKTNQDLLSKAKTKAVIVCDEPGVGRKGCPSCHKYVGLRTHICPNCQHKFLPGQKIGKAEEVNVEKRESFTKECPACTGIIHHLSHYCKYCGEGQFSEQYGIKFPNLSMDEMRFRQMNGTLSEIDEQTQLMIDRVEQQKFTKLFHEVPSSKLYKDKYYGETHKTFESVCGNYRILYGPYFMGVYIRSDKYKLMRKKGTEGWVFTDTYLFSKFKYAVKYYLEEIAKVESGEKDKQHPILQKAMEKMKKLKMATTPKKRGRRRKCRN